MEKDLKTAYVAPPNGELTITIIRDVQPRATVSLDLGIPNFTVFSMTLPLAEGQPRAMSELIAEAVSVLCDEVASFMMSLEFDERVIVNMYATVLATFKTMSNESDSAKEQDASGQDPTVKIFEGTFELPMDFVNETQRRVVTGAVKIRRDPKVRHIELTYSPKDKIKPTDTARVIRQYRNRSLRQQPKPLYVIVYDQMGRATGTIPIGSGNFKNDLLRKMKKGSSVDFTAPMSFGSEQEMKAHPLDGIPRAISVGGMTYEPEAVAGPDMALYHGPQDYLVKFNDGRSAIFPGRPTFRKMRTLNFPVPRNRYNWTMIPEEQLTQPKDMENMDRDHDPESAPKGTIMVDGLGNEEVKEAATPEPVAQPKDSVAPDQVMRASEGTVWLKPSKTYDDLVPLETLRKRLVRDKLSHKPIMEGLMVIDRIGYHGTYEGKDVVVIPQYYVRRYGVQAEDGNYQVYHLRGDGRAQKVGFHTFTAEEFVGAKPVEQGIGKVGWLGEAKRQVTDQEKRQLKEMYPELSDEYWLTHPDVLDPDVIHHLLSRTVSGEVRQEREDSGAPPEHPDWLRCDQCGKYKDDVSEVEDPYAKEMGLPGDEPSMMALCGDCYGDRVQSV
jgi:hypothetical protein